MRTKLQRTQVISRKIEERLQQEPDRPEPRRSRAGPGAEEQQRAKERRAEDVRVFAELDERELHARVLDPEPGDELRLGLEDVEGHAVLGGDARDDEREERELADDRIER